MAKKNNLFSLIKKLFISETKAEKKNQRKKWLFMRLKYKKRLGSIKAPDSPVRERVTETETETEEEVEQSKNRVNVIDDDHEEGKPNTEIGSQTDDRRCLNQMQQLAAARIQTSFRGFLARKALNALKGIVKLQALIRGRAVRRQAMTTLKYLQSIVDLQSQRIRTGTPPRKSDEGTRDKIIKMDMNSQRRWDDSLLTKEDAETMISSKKEAILKRTRIRDYAFSHRRSADWEQNKSKGRWKYWLDEWVDTQLEKSKELEDLDFNKLPPLTRNKHTKAQNSPKPDRKPFHHRKQFSLGEDDIVPTYMAATFSAKAKARSPRCFDTQSETYSPYKNNLTLLTTSMLSEGQTSEKFHYRWPNNSNHNHNHNHNHNNLFYQRSPSFRSQTGPVKSNRAVKDFSVGDSESPYPSLAAQCSSR